MLLCLQLNSYSLVDKGWLCYNLKQSLRCLVACNRYTCISCLGWKKVVVPTTGKKNFAIRILSYLRVKELINYFLNISLESVTTINNIVFNLQIEALKKAKEGNPSGRWWIKADGCDVRNGLRESMRGSWAGDEDLGDGSLQILFNDYKTRCAFVKGIGTSGRLIVKDVEKVLSDLVNDLDFLTTGAKAANEIYTKALKECRSTEQKMMELAWSAVGFDDLVKKVQGLQCDLNAFVGGNEDVNLTLIKSDLLNYLKGFFSKKRVAATHLLVFMIADELRNHKPYAIPVRFMPYKSLTDVKLRELEMEIEDAMRRSGMTVVGMFQSVSVHIIMTSNVGQ